jgi:hypothetical protein
MKKRVCGAAWLFASLLLFTGTFPLAALSFWVDGETGGVFTGYNDVQIPSDSEDDPGTRFSLAEDLEPSPVWFYRLQAGVDIGRHSIFGLYAPFTVESTGKADKDISFKKKTFPEGSDLTGTFKFNSYRLSYTYSFFRRPEIELAAGLTGKVRDAYIKLENDERSAARTNLGFVPLIHLYARWHFAPPFSLLLDGDGLAAPQGRAEDFLLALDYSLDEKTDIRLGYRLLEGGSDGAGGVYTFSMFHYASLGIRRRF